MVQELGKHAIVTGLVQGSDDGAAICLEPRVVQGKVCWYNRVGTRNQRCQQQSVWCQAVSSGSGFGECNQQKLVIVSRLVALL